MSVLRQERRAGPAIRPGAHGARSAPYARVVTQYQVTFWRDLPSMVAARDGDGSARVMLADRFQGAIDEAAMRLGSTGSDDYLDGWTKGEWTDAEGTPADVVQRIADDLDRQWPQQRLTEYLDALGPAQDASSDQPQSDPQEIA